MSTKDSPVTPAAPSFLPLGLRSRRGSVTSLSSAAPIDREQLSQALDKIHSTASQSNTLITFNEFASPPRSSLNTESKGLAGDMMQNGLSGLYSRFRGAVGAAKDKVGSSSNKVDNEGIETVSVKTPNAATSTSKPSAAPTREDSGTTVSPVPLSMASSRLQSPTASSFAGNSSESQSQALKSSTSFTTATPATSKSAMSNKQGIAPMTKATASTTIVPALAPVNVNAFKDGDIGPTGTSEATRKPGAKSSPALAAGHDNAGIFAFGQARRGMSSTLDGGEESEGSDYFGGGDSVLVHPPDSNGADGSHDIRKAKTNVKTASSALSSLQASDPIRSANSSRLVVPDGRRIPAAIERITQSHLPGYQASRASSTDRSTAETSPINTSAHDRVHHEIYTDDGYQAQYPGRLHIPGTTTNEGAPEVVSAKLEKMRKQVHSKEFWMADETCKECFRCGDTFTAFRRKHHCRTCGCIFDSKCTSIIAGERFGVQGTLRVCKTCLDVINSRHDSSGSDDSADDAALPTFFQTQQAKFEAANKADTSGGGNNHEAERAGQGDEVPVATPMMAIPATRRIGDSTNRRSAVLEIDAPQLSRPSSSRSLKAQSTAGRPPSSGHKRHQSKHNFLGRFKSTPEERAPFHRGVGDDSGRKSRLPAFHDDNIIDPDLAPYMSDEGSSADEEMSIFATMNSGNTMSASFENDRTGFGSLLSAGKRHRARTGEKSISGVSFNSRIMDDAGTAAVGGFTRPNRRRNLSTASNNLHHTRTSRQVMPGFGNLDEEVVATDESPATPTSRMTCSASMRDAKAPAVPAVELNNTSLQHVRRLLQQLLEDANIPNVSAWKKALVPILLQCTDDVNPNIRLGDDIDIRHYVKLKKIPGGKPGDTSYVSGVVFTKNLALKSMPRSISNPRIVVVSFPIEYSRHQQTFMSLEPIIAQEKEFLRNMVNRIASLRPQLLLVQKSISGLALQYLEEANIAVAYNVKQSVIEAVSRCAQTEIISSIDMVALKPVHIGKSAAFNVKTYVHNDIPGKKRTYIYLSGCPKDLGCTITLRGANLAVLSKMKRITEFMVYVVYNLKLETCLMRDEFVLIPSMAEDSGNLSSKWQTPPAGNADPSTPPDAIAAASDKLQAITEAEQQFEQPNTPQESEKSVEDKLLTTAADAGNADALSQLPEEQKQAEQLTQPTKLISAHASHSHGSHEDHVPEDIPMPTFYSDMVAKHQTKILSASPFVKFDQPYLLMRAREQERRLVYLKRLRDQDTFEEQTDNEISKPQKFQLIKPEMVHETIKRAPRQIMEVLHAVHDAEYDKALHNYQTQKRQWKTYIQGNLNLFDPYARQNITVLYTVVCTATSIPCAGPDLLALEFYNEHEVSREFDPDCTLGQYVEDLCLSANTVCASNGCDRKMSEHHRTYVHGEARITVFVEKSPCKIKGLEESILMWSYCKICKKETQIMPMSESTWKYSLGKYLELSFWSSPLRLRAGFCPHDIHREHVRFFSFRNLAVRIHYDPIDLLEIIVPRARITWKVDNDLRLKNDMFTKIEERWNRFMTSVHSRIKGINIDSVDPQKAEACKAEVKRLKKLAQEEHASMLRKLQEKYMVSKYYEIIPLNRALRAMQEKVAEWDDAFAEFDTNFFPSEKDIRRLAALQLKRMFMDRDESSTSVPSTETTDLASDVDEKSSNGSLELSQTPSNVSAEEANEVLSSLVEEHSAPTETPPGPPALPTQISDPHSLELDREGIKHLDLAFPKPSGSAQSTPSETPVSTEASITKSPLKMTDASPTPMIASPLVSTLTEKVEKLQKTNPSETGDTTPSVAEVPGIPRLSERGASRRSGMASSPPFNRTQSQPAGTLRRIPKISSRSSFSKQGESKLHADGTSEPKEPLKTTVTEPAKPSDKKLSERLGLGSLKPHRKAGQSLIPVSVHGKQKKDSKVSTLAKHFEQLSREFEKERLRDRKQRAAKVTQARAFPIASSKPIVEVYKDVNEAVEERSPTDEQLVAVQPTHPQEEVTSIVGGLAGLNAGSVGGDSVPSSPIDATLIADETATEAETDDNLQNVSQTGSDDEGTVSDNDHSLLDDMLAGATEIAESLRKPIADMPLEIPKHEKSSLMKMLTNFWAERSASGWTPLDYPINAGDHIFVDKDVVVREDEPSSLIAFTLQSEHYKAKLEEIRQQGQANKSSKNFSDPEKMASSSDKDGTHDICEDGVDQAEVETSLLRATGTHLAYSFVDASARMQCKIFFAEQFDAVRRKCGVADRIVESLSRCLKWDSKGGKTKSVFLKTLDDRLVLKSLSPIETQAFLRFAPAYFNIMSEALFHDLPSVIAKMLGFYQIVIKNPATGTEIKWDVLVMENLFYDRSPTRIFDLKGSMRNRKIQSTGEQNEVLLDENMVEFIYESPLFVREVSSSHISPSPLKLQHLIMLYSIQRNSSAQQSSTTHSSSNATTSWTTPSWSP